MIFVQSRVRNSKMKSQLLPFELVRIFKLLHFILTEIDSKAILVSRNLCCNPPTILGNHGAKYEQPLSKNKKRSSGNMLYYRF